MRTSRIVAAALALAATPVQAQQQPGSQQTGLGEVVVTTGRLSLPYAQQERPVIGLRRPADAAVMPVSISSDTREEATRKKEIHAVLLALIDRASAAGFDLVSGTGLLSPVTNANYQELPLFSAGRVDTSQVHLMVRTRLAGSAAAADKRLTDFITAAPKSGRGTIDKTGGMALTIVDPDQYRAEIVRLVAEDAKRNAAVFGPDFAFNVSGIDGQVIWSQVSGTDVFLHLPYKYTIVPKR